MKKCKKVRWIRLNIVLVYPNRSLFSLFSRVMYTFRIMYNFRLTHKPFNIIQKVLDYFFYTFKKNGFCFAISEDWFKEPHERL